MSNFIQECLSGTAKLTDIDTYIERWHQCNSDKPIHDFLGLTMYEYSQWIDKPDVLSKIVTARRAGTNIDHLLRVDLVK